MEPKVYCKQEINQKTHGSSACKFQVVWSATRLLLYKLKSLHSRSTVFRVWHHPLPFHSQIQAQETGHYTLALLGPLCQLNHRKRPDDLRSQWAPDVDGDTVMSKESYAQWPHITLWKYPNSYHMWSQSHTGQFVLQLLWQNLCCQSQHLLLETTSTVSSVIFHLCRHEHKNALL